MTRKVSAQACILSVVALFIVAVTLLVALAAQAQQKGSSQTSTRLSAAGTQSELQGRTFLLGTAGAPGTSTNHAQGRPNSSAETALDGPLFLPAAVYDSGGQLAWTLAVADLNGDGKPDVVVVNYGSYGPDGTVGVLLGEGDGTFKPTVIYDSGGGPTSGIAIADLNGDGKPDLVVANQGCPGIPIRTFCLGVLLGNGDGTFKPVVTYSDAGYSFVSGEGILIPVMIADINGDGKPDLIVISQTDKSYGDGLVGVLLGNGDGTFKPVVTYKTGGFVAFFGVLADVNGDGKPDLVVLNCSPSGSTDCNNEATVGVLLGNGDGTFQPVMTYGSGGLGGTSALVVADVNGDGKPDIIVGNNCPGNCEPLSGDGSFGVLLGKGDGTFKTAVTYDLGGGDAAWSIAVADLNGDGKLDLAVAGPGVGVWLGKGDGTFQLSNIYPTTGNTGQILLADLDHDGNLDLVDVNGTSNSADVRLGNGNGTFQVIQTFPLGGTQFSWATIAEVHGDDRPDLLSANWCSPSCSGEEGTVGVLLNNTPFCTTPPVVTLSATPTSLWPPNGKMVPVTISGTITDPETGCTLKSTAYAVKDEYGEVQPSGPVTVGAGGAYSFTVLLQASRLGSDLDGRSYTITVSASNNAGKTGSQAGAVIVPHDQGH